MVEPLRKRNYSFSTSLSEEFQDQRDSTRVRLHVGMQLTLFNPRNYMMPLETLSMGLESVPNLPTYILGVKIISSVPQVPSNTASFTCLLQGLILTFRASPSLPSTTSRISAARMLKPWQYPTFLFHRA